MTSSRSPAAFRFAPSPNGALHAGHAFSALTGFQMARRCGGRFLVRIEDIDTQRCREAFVKQILDDLRWLGLTWEEPVLRQSSRFAFYRAAAEALLTRGLLYPCWATRREIEEAARIQGLGTDPDGAPFYPGLYRNLPAAEAARRMAAGDPFCLRLDMHKALAEVRARLDGAPLTFTELDGDGYAREVAARPERWGDTVIVRKDTPASYHLAVVIDDAVQGVTHVTRGQDLLAATDVHRVLQVLLNIPAPLYHHHRLIRGLDGEKLSKSACAPSLRALREAGQAPAGILSLIGLEPATPLP